MLRRFWLFLLLPASLLAAGSFSLSQTSNLFPSKGFEDKIEFWKSIFTRYGEREVVFHDQDDLRLIYEVVRFDKAIRGDQAESRRQKQRLKKKIRELQQVFNEIRRYGVNSAKLNKEHRKIIQLLESHGYVPSSSLLGKLRGNIHPQRGIKEKFRDSLIRSGQYLNKIVKIFQTHDLPEELALLPHIESSFDYRAYSKRGAAGIWQFMYSTGRRFLRINHYVDERLDPLKSTEAAARLLRENYDVLGNWPLAVTAFNHGRNGMLRAKNRFGNDLLKIIEHYRSRAFGFAGKNFYAEFLAAIEVARNYTEYFGPLEIAPPLRFDTVSLKKAYHVSHFTQIPELTESVLQAYNPQIKNYIWKRSKIVPVGVKLRVPEGSGQMVTAALKKAPPASGPVTVAADGSARYRVQYGDTLSSIAGRFGTSVGNLQRVNNISNSNRIYPRQLLLVSGASQRPAQYRVRSGDTLIRIARQFDTSVRLLQRANQIDNPHRIHLGQVLLIP